MESCLVKSIMAGGMGFALGGAFGMFMSSVRTPWSPEPLAPGANTPILILRLSLNHQRLPNL